MNRLISKIGVVFAGFAMAVAVGIAINTNSVSRVHATTETISFDLSDNKINNLASGSGYKSGDFTYGGVDYNVTNLYSNTGQYKVNSSMGSNFSFHNTSIIPGYITKVMISTTSTTLADKFKISWGTTSAPSLPSSGTSSTAGTNEIHWTTSSSNQYRFFYIGIASGGSGTNKLTTVTIEYEPNPMKLGTPTGVEYNNSTQKVTWNAVAHASSYSFSSNNGESYNSVGANAFFDVSGLANGTTYYAKIKAVGDGTFYSDSDAASLTFTKNVAPTYTGVNLSKGELTGTYLDLAYIDCNAVVTGTNNPSQVVTWYVTETNVYGTTTSISGKASINSSGRVTFNDNCTVYVWALAADELTHNETGLAVTATGLVGKSGSVHNPYSVTEAIAAINFSGDVNGVYATGIVCGYFNGGYSTTAKITSGKVSFFISVDGAAGDDSSRIEAYNCYKGPESAAYANLDEVPEIGDEITVYGNLIKYNSIYEFAANCYVYNHESNWEFVSIELETAVDYDNNYYQGTSFVPDGLTVNYTESNPIINQERTTDVTAKAEFNADLTTAGNSKSLTATYSGHTSNAISYNVIGMPELGVKFGNAEGSVQINAENFTDVGSGWTVTTVKSSDTISFNQNPTFTQIGTAAKPASSITFSKTIDSVVTIKYCYIKLGGFGGTTGTIAIKVDDTTIGTGALRETYDVVAVSNSYGRGGKVAGKTTLTIEITGVDKGVKAYGIYYSAKSDTEMLNEFVADYMHMSHTTNDGSCKTEGWYTAAKEEYSRLHSEQKSLFNSDANYADAKARLIAWAAANGETFDPAAGTFNKNSRIVLPNYISSNITSTAIVVVISAIIGIVAIGGVIVLRRRKEK